ncbi:hypothetical protein [Litorimonas haliclonae]|uniref:hypothetical protein n=1 Tax=Litorimonas haliclonae TaxID=2081977 RepID=UPI0039EE0BA4
MKIENRQVWEQASGDGNRSYSKECLNWDVILNGPGAYGSWPEEKDRSYLESMNRPRKRTGLWRFAEEMKDGDIVVLKLGQKIGVAIGVIVGDYVWNNSFGDVDGWDLQHIRRVRWLYTKRQNFGEKVFKRGDTTQKLKSKTVLEWIKELSLNFEILTEVKTLPEDIDRGTTLDQISEYLFDNGMASGSINKLSQNMDELVRIARWYARSEAKVSEAETIAYLVIPFLQNLGWTPQRMAIEWHRVDVALFSALPRDTKNLTTVVEVKKRGNSCLTAQSQAENYADKHGCDRLVVTDGIRYGVFLRQDGEFKLHAYLNITRLKSSYPIYDCLGAQNAILTMSPRRY